MPIETDRQIGIESILNLQLEEILKLLKITSLIERVTNPEIARLGSLEGLISLPNTNKSIEVGSKTYATSAQPQVPTQNLSMLLLQISLLEAKIENLFKHKKDLIKSNNDEIFERLKKVRFSGKNIAIPLDYAQRIIDYYQTAGHIPTEIDHWGIFYGDIIAKFVVEKIEFYIKTLPETDLKIKAIRGKLIKLKKWLILLKNSQNS